LFCAGPDPESLGRFAERYPTVEPHPVEDLSYQEPDDPESLVRFVAADVTWQSGAFDALLRDIADERGPRSLFFSRASAFAFAPYDGGADIFAPTTHPVSELRRKWAPWLSSHPDGV